MSTSIRTTGAISSGIRTSGVVVAWLLLAACLLLIGTLAYDWSFTDTVFGGYLGFILPICLCICCFAAGAMAVHFSRED